MKSNSVKIHSSVKASVKNNAQHKDQKPSGLNHWILLVGLLLLTTIVFYPMLQNQFTSWDDKDYVVDNYKIQKLDAENLKFIFTQPIAANYHPFTMLSLGLNYSFSKLEPHAYYLTNMILHLINVLLVFWFTYLLSKKNSSVALFSSLIFAIHPMHVESVAWAAERKDVLYALFFIGGLTTYILYLNTSKKIFYLLTFLLALCAMLSKPAAIIFPFVIILIDFYRTGKFEIKTITDKIPFLVMASFFMYMTLVAQTQGAAVVGDFKVYSIFQRFFLASNGFVIYIIKFFIPYQLAAFHPYPKTIGAMIYLSPLLIVGILTGIYFAKELRNLLFFCFLFFLINLILVLQFVSIGSALFAERYTYVPYIGIAFVLGVILFDNKLKLNKNIVWGMTAIYCLVFAYNANARVKVWHTAETLWTDMIEKYPDSDRGYYDRGNFYSDNNKAELAIADFTNAIKNGADYKSYTNCGLAYMKLLKYKEAIEKFNYSLQLDPSQNEAYLGLGRAYFDLKKYDEALKEVNTSIEKKPAYEAYFLRGSIYKAMQKYDQAIADYTQAAGLNPAVTVYVNRGNIYFQLQNYPQAISDYNIVLGQNPNDGNALANRGAAYLQSDKLDEAIADLINAIKLNPNDARNYAHLAFAYQKKGNKTKALENANAAIKLGFALDANFMNSINQL